MTRIADETSSQTQIAQATLDKANQAVKVNIVAAGGAGGIATEATLEDVKVAVESIDSKTPADPATEAKQDVGNASLASIDGKTPALQSGAVPVISGLGVPAHDSLTFTPNPTTDVYNFYTGGLAGTLVSTVTLTYTDSTKAVLQSVVRT